MQKLLTALLLLSVVLAITAEVSAQARPIQGSPGAKADAQLRRNARVQAAQRAANRPLGDPQLGRNRPLNPNQIRKQQLQQRVMLAIGLTPEQRMRMQEIRRSHEDELVAAGRRLRQARQALDRAIMSEPYNEAEVRRATEALAAAQTDKIRLDATVRSQVRGVLTPDQVQRFHQLQREMRREMREQQNNQEKDGTGTSRPPGQTEPEEIDLLTLLSLIG